MSLKFGFCLILLAICHTNAIINITPMMAQATLQYMVNNNASTTLLTSTILFFGPAIGISNNPNDVLFYIYPYGGSKTQIVYNNATSLAASGFNPNVPTIILVDGFLSNSTSPMSSTLSESYPRRYQSGANVIVTDYGALSGAQVFLINISASVAIATYPIVVNNAPIVATRVAQFLKFIGADPSQTHLIGHSLGAHISGMAGTYAQTNYNSNYSRISGLDPAGPLFTANITVPPNQQLSSGNAAFIDAIHTNMGEMGTLDTTSGDIDIFVNGGFQQPGCSTLDYPPGETPGVSGLTGYCSHSYSWRVMNNTVFNDMIAGACDASLFNKTSCFYSTTPTSGYYPNLPVGENIPYGASGKYSLYSTDAFTEYDSVIG